MNTLIGKWTIKRKVNGAWRVEREFCNLITAYGLNAFASAPSKDYVPPSFLALDGKFSYLAADVAAGATSLFLSDNPMLDGDTQLVVSAGIATGQEVVTVAKIEGDPLRTVTLA